MIPERVYRHAISQFFAPLSPLLEDPSVSEVMVNGYDRVFVERKGRIERVEACFPSEAALSISLRGDPLETSCASPCGMIRTSPASS